MTAPRVARAWYFPEHLVLTQEGLDQLPRGVRGVIGAAMTHAKSEGLNVCDAVDVPIDRLVRDVPLTTRMIHVEKSVPCVPYSALPALGADHSSSAFELRAVLKSHRGVEITSAAAYEWSRFSKALDQLPNTSIERMAFVHALDVAFYFVDPGYEQRAQKTRAHFTDASRPFADVVRSAGKTNLDNSVEQFLAHHLRSLELAARGDATEAVLEHGFALHFLQDAFASGHLIAAGWDIENPKQRRRHDYYNARGLPVGRAMAVETCTTLGEGTLETVGLPPCWVAYGDGYLGLSPDASDRLHASRAMAKAQLQFAIALDGPRVVAAAEALDERQQVALGHLLDPTPWWTIRAESRRHLRSSAARALKLVRGASHAISHLRYLQNTPPIVVGAHAPARFFDPNVFVRALEPCVAAEESGDDPDAEIEGDDLAACGPGRRVAVGSVGVLLRAVLAEWPATQDPPESLGGESKEDIGWAVQLLASVSGSVVVPSGHNVDFYLPSIGVAAGLSYRWGTYLPGRLNRSVVELNAGISDALHYDSARHAGGNPHVTMLDQELRWPILYEILNSYRLPFDLRRAHGAGHVVALSGIRTHVMISSKPVFWGIELEALAFALTTGRGAYPLYAASPEIRLYLGTVNANAAQPALPSTSWAPMIGLALTGGYATFL